MTKTQKAMLKAKSTLGKIKNKTNELVAKNNPTVPDEIKEKSLSQRPNQNPNQNPHQHQEVVQKA